MSKQKTNPITTCLYCGYKMAEVDIHQKGMKAGFCKDASGCLLRKKRKEEQ